MDNDGYPDRLDNLGGVDMCERRTSSDAGHGGHVDHADGGPFDTGPANRVGDLGPCPD